jgi:aspartokinase-like uncharacterized kinase
MEKRYRSPAHHDKQPLVVKLGGSLFRHIPKITPELAGSPRPLLIVPGGGPFADAVRMAGVHGDAAHWMAVCAMDQFGWFCSSFGGIPVTTKLHTPQATEILLPYEIMRKRDPLPHTWDITSDTIAAWVAADLGLELLLLKSVDGILKNGVFLETVSEPLATDIVDPCCIPFILKHRLMTTVLNGSDPPRIALFLKGEPVPCTKIGTTF